MDLSRSDWYVSSYDGSILQRLHIIKPCKMWQVRYTSLMAGQCRLPRHEITAARVGANVAPVVRACCRRFGRLLYATAYYLGGRPAPLPAKRLFKLLVQLL